MAIDYTKFDKIDDVDEKKIPAPEICGNCGSSPSAPLRCGACKSKIYCSAECQRLDWKFHKRNCSPAKPTVNPVKPPPLPAKPEPPASEDEKLSWYRHREWKAPDVNAPPAPSAVATPAAPVGNGLSVWNAAQTWEEKDYTKWAKDWIIREISESSKVEGDASTPVVRGVRRFLFDLTFTWKFEDVELSVSEFSDGEDCPVIKAPRGYAGINVASELLQSKRLAFIKEFHSM